MIVTDAGVLELGDESVSVRASAPAGSRVVAVVGREADVLAWVGPDAYTRVTGLADEATLATTAGEPVEPLVVTPSPSESPTQEPSPSSSPSGSEEPSGEASPSSEASPSTTDEEDGADASTEDEEAADAENGATPTTGAPDPSSSDMWVAS